MPFWRLLSIFAIGIPIIYNIMKKSTIYLYLILFLFLFFTSHKVNGKEKSWYSFKQISIEQGLSYSNVQCILRESTGTLWIGTKNGLNRFDQYELKSFYHKKGTSSLPANHICFLAEDSLNNIWVGTLHGLALYHPETSSFSPALYKDKPVIAYSFCLHSGSIIFGCDNKLLQYNYSSKQISPLPVSSTENIVSADKIINFSDSVLLLSNRYEGIYQYNITNHKLQKLPQFNVSNIAAICVDHQQRIWLSPYKKGLYCYDISGKEIHYFTQTNSMLSNDLISDILEKDDQLWIATDGSGINIYTPSTQSFEIINNIPEDLYSLPEKAIRCLYNDPENNIWAGTVRGGILNIKKVYIKKFKNVPLDNPYGLSDKVIVSLYEEPTGILWVGTDGGGINSFDPQTQKFKHYQTTYPEKVVSIAPFSEKELLISFYSKGIFIFNKKSQSLQPFIIVNEETNKKECTGISVHIAQGLKDDVFFLGNKIRCYNKKTKKFFEIESPNEELQRCLLKVALDDSLMYLMTLHNIVRLNLHSYQLESVCEFSDLDIQTAAYDKKRIWIGTHEGLFYYDLKQKTVTKKETSIFQSVTSLSCDNDNRLWIGADKNLFCYYIDRDKYIILGESDNAPINELFHLPLLTTFNNYIYLGGNNGLVNIDKNISFDLPEQPIIRLSDILVNGISRFPEIYKNNNISIPWNTTSLELKLNVKENDLFRKRLFRYNIIGMQGRNIETYSHILNIGTLPPGDYTVTISCNTHNGEWSSSTDLLYIQVTPPFWKTTWFIVLCIFLICILIIGALYFIIKKKQNKLKEQLLVHEKKINEDKVRFLINISHELRTPLTLIYSPMKRILDHEEKIKDLSYELRSMFKQVCQMKDIINMVLDMRSIEAGNNKLQILPHSLNRWIHSVGDGFKKEFEYRDICLDYKLDETINEICFDQAKCTIVLSNLLMNAVKYTHSSTNVIIMTENNESKNRVRIAVVDRGPGLMEADIDKLFTRFYQGKHNTNGNGIGLSYAKTIIEIHGGEIGAFNNPTVGATFYFDLPYSKEFSLSTPQPVHIGLTNTDDELAISDMTDTFDMCRFSLLIVEDETELKYFLKKTLKEYFKHIYTATNGVDALSIINEYMPDIVVSDIMMPHMDGFELCKTVKSRLQISHIPIILLTARSDEDSHKIGYKLGADAYLTKPFDVDILIGIIKSVLKNRIQIKQKYLTAPSMPKPVEGTTSNADEHFLLKLNELILCNLDNPNLNVTFVIDQMRMGRSSFYSKIKTLTNISANDYINKIRIEKASELLATTELSILEISEQVGFEYPRYFSSVFKQLKGITPTQFRKQNISQKKEEI